MNRKHVFAVCAYGESPYLEACVRSLKSQTLTTDIILCTSTPSDFLTETAARYDIPLYVRDGESGICEDWNFAYETADAELVTIAHQDDCYHKDYASEVQRAWETYPDTTVFTTDCVVVKNHRIQKPDTCSVIKHLLRLPLRFPALADRSWVKKASLIFGNPIICPSCTYDKTLLGTPLFDSEYKFVLDWEQMWKLASRPGRFVCVERPLIFYRVHEGAATKACIENHTRSREEAQMYAAIWHCPAVEKLLMRYYRKAYGEYGNL